MQIEVNSDYLKVIKDFKWPESQVPLEGKQLEAIIEEISKVIFAASHIRQMTSAASGKQLSLSEVFIIIKQGQDENNLCLPLLEKTTISERCVLKHTFQVLSKNHKSVDIDDLKCVTLLFGIERVHQILEEYQNLALKSDHRDQLEQLLDTLLCLKRKLNELKHPQDKLQKLEIMANIVEIEAKILKIKYR